MVKKCWLFSILPGILLIPIGVPICKSNELACACRQSITTKLLTLGTAGKGQAEAGILEFIFMPGRLAMLSGNLLCFSGRNVCGISARPAISHSGYRDKTHTLQFQRPWYQAKLYQLCFSYQRVVNIWQCARIFLESCEPGLKGRENPSGKSIACSVPTGV